jgi:hypothetical protein
MPTKTKADRKPKFQPSEDEFTTDAMRVAVVQRWTIPEGTKVQLEAELAAIEDAPPVEHFAAQLDPAEWPDTEAAAKEAKRRARNAQVNVWRQRTRLQAALDTRSAQFKRIRAQAKKAS